ncbi:SUN domain-containing protein 1 isoform X1 [Dendrobium catenatum]|uniref:SUN domain-containing protein n=1 Tax=Dendrobium catenatum TaxID=906689 RepID=A0A2I0VKY5_9ASPA|nr:SUN domain-containing protein 1 isoform X1 [Dendrobium catenatum]XP_020673597.1 SUN domain-containing protein 1 isoform X1 [Dendrobium catenatum]PKU64078.1 hypothetical protein MA16_Dca007984 [Dendrobium catenatum]
MNPKSSILADGGLSAMNNGNGIANGNDPSHTIRRDYLLERSRELSQLRKGVQSSLQLKKSVHRRRRSWWSILFTILTRIVLILAALLYLGQFITRCSTLAGRDTKSSFALLDYEDRVSEVENSLKITSKMLQVQVEVIDKKIGNEIGIVKRELQKQFQEKKSFIEMELNQLESRTDELSKSLADLEDRDLLTKGELEKFWNELKSKGNVDDISKDVDLDEIMAMTKEIVEKEIDKHSADGLGRVDYALASGGAKVVSHSEPYVYGKGSSWLAVAKGISRVHSNAQKMLEPSFGEPGQCFPLQGSSGFVEIRLRTGIIPEAITLEHVSKSVAYDRSSAPKDCRVSGWFEEPEDDPSARIDKMFVLTDFSYDLEKSNAQTFAVPVIDSGIINMVRLDFTSNHGNSALTCIYRIRVHGYEPSSPAAITTHA